MDNLFKTLWNSSTGLIKRFNLNPSHHVALQKAREEFQEFSLAVTKREGDPIEEAADLIVTVFNTLTTKGYYYSDLETAIRAVIAKNDAKTEETHHIVNGLIENKGKPHKPIPKPLFDDEATIGEKYDPAMYITDPDDAKTYLSGLVDHTAKWRPEMSIAEIEAQERGNLGYYAGYFDGETMRRVNKLFGAVHPIFGMTMITSEEAFQKGLDMSGDKQNG